MQEKAIWSNGVNKIIDWNIFRAIHLRDMMFCKSYRTNFGRKLGCGVDNLRLLRWRAPSTVKGQRVCCIVGLHVWRPIDLQAFLGAWVCNILRCKIKSFRQKRQKKCQNVTADLPESTWSTDGFTVSVFADAEGFLFWRGQPMAKFYLVFNFINGRSIGKHTNNCLRLIIYITTWY